MNAKMPDEVEEQEFYTGKEAYLSTIFGRWRTFHIITLTVTFLAALIACFSFVAYDSKFQPYCPLFAKVKISKIEANSKKYLFYFIVKKNEPDGSIWGPDYVCAIVLYTPMASMLTALTWILLFCGQIGQRTAKGNFSYTSQWKHVPPTCITGFVMTVVAFASAVTLTIGGSKFCDSFATTELESCEMAQRVHWAGRQKMHAFYDYLKQAQICYWLITHSWLLHSIMALIRWNTDADYVIAEERELEENVF